MKQTLQAPLLTLLLWQTHWYSSRLWIHARSVPRSSGHVGLLANFTVDTDRRVELLRRSNPNLVTLSCRNQSTLTVLAEADFWVTHDPASESAVPVELTATLESAAVPYHYPSPPLAEIAFRMQPDIEGYFFCGDLPSMVRSENSVILLAYPAPHDNYVDCYPANVNQSVVLNCPFQRGLLEQFYTFVWILHDFRLVFDSSTDYLREGFTANSSDFSLTIPEVSYSHQGRYTCWLQVHNPGSNTFISPEISLRLEIERGNSTPEACPQPVARTTVFIRTSTSTFVTPSVIVRSMEPENESRTVKNSNRRDTSHFPKVAFIFVTPLGGVIIVVLVSCVPYGLYHRRRKRTVKWKPNDSPKHRADGGNGNSFERPTPSGADLQANNSINESNSSSKTSDSPSIAPSPYVSSNASLTESSGSGPLREVCIADVHDVSRSSTFSSSSEHVMLERAPSSTIIAQSTIPSTGIAASSSVGTLVPNTHEPESIQGEIPQHEQECTPTHTVEASALRKVAPADLPIKTPLLHSSSRPSTPKRYSGPSSSVMSPFHSGLTMNPLSPGSYRTYDRSNPGQSADTMVLLQPTEDYQDDSNNFVFLGSTQVLVCDSQGGKYEVSEQGISVRIPPNALDTEAHIEVGVAIHGSFKFPASRQPISAIVWLVVRGNSDFVFKKPVEIQLPHFLDLSNSDIDEKGDEFRLGFITTNEETDRRQQLIFTEGPSENVVYLQRSAKVIMDRFCFVCLSAKESVISERSKYLLTQVFHNPIKTLQWDLHFCVSYDLDSFAKMIRDQYSKQNPMIKFKGTPFQFSPSTTKGAELLRIRVNYETTAKGWIVAFQNSQQVKKSVIHEVWENDVSDLQAKLKLKAYPPRISATVYGDAAFDNVKALVSFEGAFDQESLVGEVPFVLPTQYVDENKERLNFLRSQSLPTPDSTASMELVAYNKSLSGPPNITEQPSAIPDQPNNLELVEVMKMILAKFTSWPILIQALGIPEHRGQEILQETHGVKTQILKILNTWVEMHMPDRTCTRTNLATVLRKIDDSLIPAARLLEKMTYGIES